LNLSDEQKAQIKKILDDEATNTKDLREKLRSLHQSEPEPFSSTFDEAAARLTAEARAKIDVELQVAHARTMSQVAALLTADQKAQLTASDSSSGKGHLQRRRYNHNGRTFRDTPSCPTCVLIRCSQMTKSGR
jgi:Spy/CpxP family protein refolding chaperone